MSGPSQPQNQTVTSTQTPWNSGFLSQVQNQAQGLSNQGIGSTPSPYSQYVGMNPYTVAGLESMANIAQGPNSLSNIASQNMTNFMTGNNTNPYTQPITQAGGWHAQNILGQGNQQNWALNRQIANNANDIRNNVAGMFARGGRYGSGAHQQVLGREIGRMATDMRSNNFNQMMNRNLQGAGMAAQTQMGALGQAGQLANSDLARQLQAQALAPQINNMRYQDAQMLGQVGAAYEQDAANQLADLNNQFMQGQQMPWNTVNQLSGIGSGLGALGGTGTNTSPNPNFRSPMQQALGGAALGGSLASGLGMMGPPGWAMMGLGALGGAFL